MTIGREICVKSSGLNTEVKGFHVPPPTPTPRHPGGKAAPSAGPPSGGHLLAFLGLIPDPEEETRVSSRARILRARWWRGSRARGWCLGRC